MPLSTSNLRPSAAGTNPIGRHPGFPGRILLAILVAVVFVPLGASAQSAPDRIKLVPSHRLGSLDGESVYRTHCAVCHGIDGWTTSATAHLSIPVPNLATLAQRHGEYNRLHVRTDIENAPSRKAHEPMPRWEHVFVAGTSRGANAIVIRNLVRHVETLQVASQQVASQQVASQQVASQQVACEEVAPH